MSAGDRAIAARRAAQATILLMRDLAAFVYEQIGELERLHRTGEEFAECYRCGMINPRTEWIAAGVCPCCRKTTL